MSLTLVGNALSCPVASSWQIQLSVVRRGGAGLDRQECDVEVQPSPDGQIFPIALPGSGPPQDRRHAAGQDAKLAHSTAIKQKSPWAKLFAQGATTVIVD